MIAAGVVLVVLGAIVAGLAWRPWVVRQRPLRESERQIARLAQLKRDVLRDMARRARQPAQSPRTKRSNALWDRT
jgi:hypothetical protein